MRGWGNWGLSVEKSHSFHWLRAFIIVAATSIGCLTPVAAYADLKLCNATTGRIGVALGYQDKKGWATEGWWNIPSKTCESLLKGTLPSRYLYVHAVDYERGGEWTGRHIMCTKDNVFTIRNTKQCSKRGFNQKGFYEIDTGTSQSWTIRLADPEKTTKAK
jgi:uncharacterized membrane protein